MLTKEEFNGAGMLREHECTRLIICTCSSFTRGCEES